MLSELPVKGFVFWPVGNGDSATIAIDDETVMQVDLNHLESADDEEDARVHIIDELVSLLPKVDGKPYLSVFALTHPDLDHCRGFKELLSKVTIGEIWHSPRVFREYLKDLSDDATAFRKEAKRRVKTIIQQEGAVDSGDRLRLIGYDELLKEDDYEGFPVEFFTVPGHKVTDLDGKDLSTVFEAFIHAPFKDDAEEDRNDTSLAFQITLKEGEGTGQALFLGDHCYPTLKKIFDISKEEDLAWNILLAPHHCSKSAMYWKDEGEEQEKLRDDILKSMGSAAGNPGYIIASSVPVPAQNQSGDNPPHAKAKNRYQEIVPDEFLCTQEHTDEENPIPIVFTVDKEGLEYQKPKKSGKAGTAAGGLGGAVKAARGGDSHTERVGFG